ncbi:hypothetical protein [Flavobacterium cerinum]|uniref:Uncharacterized protein n=1 Tax=Flavobacterium cerinum TaxID=2502784 RepID=A0A444GMV2_9FLAO|nr:hypothetical protein [Flavobacterium cerinum]RWW92332.1 hypothetical protein EPI11_15590 [Flavobacterium cerinum]
MKFKAVILLGTLIAATVSTIMFMRFSNDHKECHTTIKRVTNVKGKTVTVQEHVCKEKYNI